MSLEVNKVLVRRFIDEVLNQGKFELMSQYYATPELAQHMRIDGQALRQGFPDLLWIIEDIFGQDDNVAVRWTAIGTNTGPFMGRPPTGKTVRWGGATITGLQDGKFVEEWIYPKTLDMLQQIGLIPASIPALPGHRE